MFQMQTDRTPSQTVQIWIQEPTESIKNTELQQIQTTVWGNETYSNNIKNTQVAYKQNRVLIIQ